jgi:ParB family chromosome partitioning protein
MNYEKGQLYHIPLSDLQPDPNQPRKFMDPQALDDLSASITAHGVLTPILFRIASQSLPAPEGATAETPSSYWIVAGERRFEAAKKAGLTDIPAILVEGKTSEIALVENLLLSRPHAGGGSRGAGSPPKGGKLHPGAVGCDYRQGTHHGQ